MSVVDDARRLAEVNPFVTSDRTKASFCTACGTYWDHHADCPWMAVPRIVAALEAAQLVAERNGRMSDGRIGKCPSCGGSPMSGDRRLIQAHYSDCPIKALIDALNPEVVPSNSAPR